MRRRATPPLWFLILLAVAAALALRALDLAGADAGAGADDGPRVQLAFWGFLIGVAGWIWRGLQVVGQVTLHALSVLVNYLWAFAITVNNTVLALGKTLWAVLRRAWGFLRATYERVLRPAWIKFWKFVQWAEHALQELFGPLIRFVRFLRTWLLGFYAKYIRPILDLIDIARRFTRVLAALGVEWARALDRRLAELEARIEAPFRYVVGILNDILNVINRIVTLDGLFQRLVLIRSIERDLREVTRAITNWRTVSPENDARARTREQLRAYSVEQARRNVTELLETRGGRFGGLLEEVAADWRRYLAGAPR